MEKQNEKELQVRPVLKDDPAYAEVVALYKEAFPFKERFSVPALRFFARKSEIEFLAYFDPAYDGRLCGISYTIEAGDYIYILYLAISKDIRGQGYGTRILHYLGEKYPGKSLVLEIEPLDPSASNYEQRKARLAFYERNGFKLVGYDLFEGSVRYSMLATGDDFNPDDFARVVRKLSHGLYRFKIHPVQKEL